MIRTFIAIVPPSDLRQAIETVRRTFAEHAAEWRWVKPENVHLTLKFLGDVPAEAVDPIAQAMQAAVTGQPPFRLTVRNLGCFPGLTRPRILWMGLEDPRRALPVLYQGLETALTHQGFSPESRPFHPHLTLARTQRKIDRRILQHHIEACRNRQFGVIHVGQIVLFQSRLRPQGPDYTIIRSVVLQS